MGRDLNNEFRKESLTNEEFDFFVNDVIVPRFLGFTILEVKGYWKGKAEDTFVLEVLDDGAASDVKIQQIADAYVSRYHQEAVMVLSQEVTETFVTA